MKKNLVIALLPIILLFGCSSEQTKKTSKQVEKEVTDPTVTKETENPSMKSFERRAAVIKNEFGGIITDIKLSQVDNVYNVIVTVDKAALSKASEDLQKNFGYRSRTKVKGAVANSGLQEYGKTIVKYFSAEDQAEMIFE
ncbi:hypothetical protein COE51_14515 [Bacillus pseudomycoides]|nr:hypothetical protein COE51_14515 [Bacillus pseudomycoides]